MAKKAAKKQQRRIVYFLGAGASKGAGAYAKGQGNGKIEIPIQATFWETYLRFCKKPANRKKIEAFLYKYFLGYKKVPTRTPAAQRRREFKNINVEEVFTFLSERIQAPATSQQLRQYSNEVWEALVSEIGTVFSKFKSNQRTRNTYRSLLRKHVRARDTIVSFNYDLIFESSLPHNRRWYYEALSPHDGLRVLKPHGSINWEAGKDIKVKKSAVNNPVVVAPTHLKFTGRSSKDKSAGGYLNFSPQISDIWSEMERQMTEAKALVFIGYSFPSADLYFSSVLRSVLAKRRDDPAIVIVNPDAVEIRRRLEDRFAISNVGVIFDIDTFVQMTREQVIRARSQF